MIFVFLGLIFRVVITLYICLFEVGNTLTYDSVRFYEDSLDYATYLTNKNLYPELTFVIKNHFPLVIGNIFYLLKFESYLVTSLFSDIIWFLSAIVFYKILIKLQYEKKIINITLFIYTFIFPTSIIYTSLLLREPYILFFFNILALYLINLSLNFKDNIYKNLLLIFLCSYFLFFLHDANKLFLIALFSSLFFLHVIKKFNIKYNYVVFLFLIFILLFENYGFFEKIFIEIKTYLSGHFFENNFERATYFLMEEITSLEYSFFALVSLIFKNFINYLFQPFIYKVSSFKDLILFCENIVRLVFIWMTLKKFFIIFNNKNIFYILFLMYFFMELIYAQATVNWGTASRHHVPSIGLLILLAYFPTKYKKI